MASEEKRSWILVAVALAGYLTYLALVLLGGVSYVPAMLWTIGVAIVLSIVLHIATTIRGPHEPKDERDREIAQFGDHVGNAMVVIGGLIALVMALFEARHSWIANALYLGFVLSAVLGGLARISAYRTGLPARRQW
jgi:uncharacterized membrane protein